METYRIITPVEHDQQRFEPGAAIDLDDAAAAPLLAVGAIDGPIEASKEAPAKAGK